MQMSSLLAENDYLTIYDVMLVRIEECKHYASIFFLQKCHIKKSSECFD